MKRKVTAPYHHLFEELAGDRYCIWSVYDYFIQEGPPSEDKVNVIIRVDVDRGLHLCTDLASILKEKNIKASFYFLTFPERYYNIWESSIPKLVAEKRFEVGLHTDHYYEQLISGKDAIEGIRKDVKKLSDCIGTDVYGMTYHGHPAINALGTTNWEVYKTIPAEKLGLVYHDGVDSPYTAPGEGDAWKPNTTHPILTDYMKISGAWKYCPWYPVKLLQTVLPGQSIHICIHPHNAFTWWEDWDHSYQESMPERDTLSRVLTNTMRIGIPCLVQQFILYVQSTKEKVSS